MEYKILDKLKSEGVVLIRKIEDKYEFRDGCDQWFSCLLTKEEVEILIEELKEFIK